MELLNTVERLMLSLNLPGDFADKHPKFKNEVISEDWNGVHPHEFVNIAGNPQYTDIQTDLLSKLKQWRELTKDPLLSDNILRALTKEVLSVKTKSVARKHQWKYPDYFFGLNPNSSN